MQLKQNRGNNSKVKRLVQVVLLVFPLELTVVGDNSVTLFGQRLEHNMSARAVLGLDCVWYNKCC